MGCNPTFIDRNQDLILLEPLGVRKLILASAFEDTDDRAAAADHCMGLDLRRQAFVYWRERLAVLVRRIIQFGDAPHCGAA